MNADEANLQTAEILQCFEEFNQRDYGQALLDGYIQSNKTDFFIISTLMKELRKIVSKSTQFQNSIYYQDVNLYNQINRKIDKLEEKNISKIQIFRILLEAMRKTNNKVAFINFVVEKIKILSSDNESSTTNQKRKRKIKINEEDLTSLEKRNLYAAASIEKDRKNVFIETSDFLASMGKNGQGLYAKKSFAKGEKICGYFGKLVPTEDIEKHDYKSDYLITLGKDENGIDMSVDAADSDINVSGYGKFINDPIYTDKINSYIVVYTDDLDYIGMFATKGIKAGEEILCNYGVEYWQDDQFLKLSPELQAEINRQRVSKNLPTLQIPDTSTSSSSSSSQVRNIPVSSNTKTASRIVIDLTEDD